MILFVLSKFQGSSASFLRSDGAFLSEPQQAPLPTAVVTAAITNAAAASSSATMLSPSSPTNKNGSFLGNLRAATLPVPMAGATAGAVDDIVNDWLAQYKVDDEIERERRAKYGGELVRMKITSF